MHLDAIRGVAALAVLAYHVRYNFFVDYSQLPQTTWAARLFYTATSFGHDAVVVFFVLSGYLISGSILKDLRGGTWSWRRYLLNRTTRLYVVLVPGLLMTVFWDQLGMRLFAGHPVYTGAPQAWIHNFFPVAERATPVIFFKNLAFLHAIAGTPAYGTAGSLWSLTYEFAYYLIFPAALCAVWPGVRWPQRAAFAVITLLLANHFGNAILLAFPIWLLGFALQLLPRAEFLQRRMSDGVVAGVGAAMVAGIAATHLSPVRDLLGGDVQNVDYLTGVICALGLFVVLHDRRAVEKETPGLYVRLAAATANISYTLYVVHLTFLVFLRAALVKGAPWTVTLGTTVAAAALCAVAIGYAAFMWWVAEARTATVREFVSDWLVWPWRRSVKSAKPVEFAGA